MRNQRGVILLSAYMIFAVMTIMALAVFTRGSIYVQSAERNKKKIVAFNLAEAGFDQAYYNIKNSVISSYPWSSGYTSMTSGNMQGGYSVTVTDLGGGFYKIFSSGYSPSQSSTTTSVETRPITSYVQSTTQSAFPFGVFAVQTIALSGNAQTDSYDSRNGAYGGANKFSRGDVGTDSIGASTLTVSGNAKIKGTATVGPNGNPSSVISTSGNATVQATATALAAQNPGDVTSPVGSEGSLIISGNTTYTLTAGIHRFSSISITGNAKLNPVGAVTIYVDGALAIAGNGIGTYQNTPTNMQIYLTGNGAVSISGNANLYAGVYAPNSAVSNTGNGELYGAVVSNTYQQSGNGKIHFDEALKDISISTGANLTVKSWQENNVTAGSTTTATATAYAS